MLGLSCNYDPNQHELIRPEMLDWCKRQVSERGRADKLFMYHHLIEDTFVIGEWLNGPRGPFVDLKNLGQRIHMTREEADNFVCGLNKPDNAASLMRKIRKMTSDHNSDLAENQAEIVENRQKMKRGV